MHVCMFGSSRGINQNCFIDANKEGQNVTACYIVACNVHQKFCNEEWQPFPV